MRAEAHSVDLSELTANLRARCSDGDATSLREVLARYPGQEERVARVYFDLGDSAPAMQHTSAGLSAYHREQRLWRDSTVEAWLATDDRTGRKAVVKQLLQVQARDDRARRRFLQEAHAVGRLRHPYLSELYDCVLEGSDLFFAMRYVAGETLSDALLRRESVEASEPIQHASDRIVRAANESEVRSNLAFFEQCLRALHAAHESGVVHNNLTPSCILVAETGKPLVFDFGSAWIDEQPNPITHSARSASEGNEYAAPESVTDGGLPDRRTDVYSMAGILKSCFCPDTEDPHVQPRAPRDLVVVLAKALDPQPQRRFGTALEFAEELHRIRAYEPIKTSGVGLARQLVNTLRRNPWPAIGIVALLAGGLFAALTNLRAQRGLERAESSRNKLTHVIEEIAYEEENDVTSRARRLLESQMGRSIDPRIRAACHRLSAREDFKNGDLAAAARGFRHGIDVSSSDSSTPRLRWQLELLEIELTLEQVDRAASTIDAIRRTTHSSTSSRFAFAEARFSWIRGNSSALDQMLTAFAAWQPRDEAAIDAGVVLLHALLESNRTDEAAALSSELAGADDPRVRSAQGELLRRQGNITEALETSSKAFVDLAEAYSVDHPATLLGRRLRARCLINTGRISDAARQLNIATRGIVKTLGPDHSERLRARRDLEICWAKQRPTQDSRLLLRSKGEARRSIEADLAQVARDKATANAAIAEATGRRDGIAELQELEKLGSIEHLECRLLARSARARSAANKSEYLTALINAAEHVRPNGPHVQSIRTMHLIATLHHAELDPTLLARAEAQFLDYARCLAETEGRPRTEVIRRQRTLLAREDQRAVPNNPLIPRLMLHLSNSLRGTGEPAALLEAAELLEARTDLGVELDGAESYRLAETWEAAGDSDRAIEYLDHAETSWRARGWNVEQNPTWRKAQALRRRLVR